MKKYIFTFFTLIFFFFLPQSVWANNIFIDSFNGNGELSQYNISYIPISAFHPNIGSFSLFTNHLETTGFDPAYIYSGFPEDNTCASIDFNWTNGEPTGHWTNIMIHSTQDKLGGAFQIRNDDATHQRWIFYNSIGESSFGSISFDENLTHTLKACVSGSKVEGYLDSILLFSGHDPYYTTGYMGFASQTPTYYLDNFRLDTFNSVEIMLPLIKQTDPLWRNNVYDSANIWSPNDAGIGSWGCALTSAAMVFQYHNITKMPDNSSLNPDTLNTWLKKQPDGYVNEGWVNWLALSRLSKEAKSKNPLFTYDALEYKRFPGENKTQLSTDLSNNIPDILEEPGHFIVAKGQQGSTYSINDPFYTRTSLTDYGNTFKNLGRFTPSNTDLSYLLLFSDKDTSITLKDSNGNLVGQSFIQYPIENDNNPGQPNGQAFNMFLLDKPLSGNYTILLNSSSPHIYSLHSYLYDTSGQVIINNVNGTLGNGEESYSLQFNKENNKKSNITHNISFDSVINDIRELQSNNLILPDIADNLVLIINKAKNPQGNNLKASSLAALGTFREAINRNKGKGIDQKAYDILFSDVKELVGFLV